MCGVGERDNYVDKRRQSRTTSSGWFSDMGFRSPAQVRWDVMAASEG